MCSTFSQTFGIKSAGGRIFWVERIQHVIVTIPSSRMSRMTPEPPTRMTIERRSACGSIFDMLNTKPYNASI